MEIKTVGDLKELIKDIPDWNRVYLFDVGVGGTVYDAQAEFRTQECIEHSGKKWNAHGLMIEIGD